MFRSVFAALRRWLNVPARLASDLSIRTKLAGGFGLVVALAAVVAWAGLNAVGRVDSELADLYDNGLQPIRQLNGAAQAVADFDRDVRAHVLATDSATINMLADQIGKDENELTTLLDEYQEDRAGQDAAGTADADRPGVAGLPTDRDAGDRPQRGRAEEAGRRAGWRCYQQIADFSTRA